MPSFSTPRRSTRDSHAERELDLLRCRAEATPRRVYRAEYLMIRAEYLYSSKALRMHVRELPSLVS